MYELDRPCLLEFYEWSSEEEGIETFKSTSSLYKAALKDSNDSLDMLASLLRLTSCFITCLRAFYLISHADLIDLKPYLRNST